MNDSELDPSRSEPAIRIPRVTGWLIALNVLVHLVLQLVRFVSPGQDELVIERLGFAPDRLDDGVFGIVSLVSYQFIHGSWAHVGINMVSLLAFGPGVERPLGRVRFVLLYLISGIAGALVEAAFVEPGTGALIVGASASVSGVLGAILVLYGVGRRGPRPIGMLPTALVVIALMAVTGIVGVGSQGAPVAWIAHIGGFLAGMAVGALLRPRTSR